MSRVIHLHTTVDVYPDEVLDDISTDDLIDELKRRKLEDKLKTALQMEDLADILLRAIGELRNGYPNEALLLLERAVYPKFATIKQCEEAMKAFLTDGEHTP